MNLFSRILKIKTPRKTSLYHFSLLALLPLVKGVAPSPDRKMIKFLTFDDLFPPLRHSRKNSYYSDDGYDVFPPK